MKGYDGGKKLTGRKRHILVDTLGLLLAVCVHSAKLHDRDGADLLLTEDLAESFPRVEVVFGDAGYSGQCQKRVEDRLGWRMEVVRRPPGGWSDDPDFVVRTKPDGFQVLRWRWIVERTFAWLGRHRRLSKDYEHKAKSSRTWILIAMSSLMLRRLAARAT